jgi:hypothetical protein
MPERDLTEEQLLAVLLTDRFTHAERQGVLDAWLNQDGSNPILDDADRQRRLRGRRALRQHREDFMQMVDELNRRYAPESIERLIDAFHERGFRQASNIADQAADYLEARAAESAMEEQLAGLPVMPSTDSTQLPPVHETRAQRIARITATWDEIHG